MWGRFNTFINKFGYHNGTQKYLGMKVWDLSFLALYLKRFIFLEAKIKTLSNCKIFDEFYSKLGYFSCSLEKNTHKFGMTIIHFKINPCVKMLKWRATRHSKAEKLNFVLRKCKCSLGNSRWLISKSGYHAENPWKTRYFYFEALFGYHKGSWWYPKVFQEKVWYFSFKMTCRTYFLDC